MLELRDYQRKTVDWLLSRQAETGVPHGYVAHDPGLGKTITAIAFLKEYKAKSALIICPPKIKDTNLGSWAYRMVEWGLCSRDEIGIIQSQMFSQEWNRPYDTSSASGARQARDASSRVGKVSA
jgi:hypothetical protein